MHKGLSLLAGSFFAAATDPAGNVPTDTLAQKGPRTPPSEKILTGWPGSFSTKSSPTWTGCGVPATGPNLKAALVGTGVFVRAAVPDVRGILLFRVAPLLPMH